MQKSKTKPQPIAKRGGRYRVLVELDPEDNRLLDRLVRRYGKQTKTPTKAFVLRQLLRHVADGDELPPIKLT